MRTSRGTGLGDRQFGVKDWREPLDAIARSYPEALQQEQLSDVDRQLFHLSIAAPLGMRVADLGGGIGLFSLAMARAGKQVWLVDDFGDSVNREYGEGILSLHQEMSVEIVATDVLSWGDQFQDESLDVVTCFDSLEHWHHSPKPVLAEAHRKLHTGGWLLVSTPNAVNIRKRLTVPFGKSNWSHFDDWFYPETFRGHVREPVVSDLERALEETGFVVREIWGRNWEIRKRGIVGRVLDKALRLRPSLCSNLYILGAKP